VPITDFFQVESEKCPSALETSAGFAVHFTHDVVDPGSVFLGGIQFDEVVQSAEIEGSVAFEGVDEVEALS